jgi:UDP-galactose transporter B1
MNVFLYRRKFAPHKYAVVALVTIGITCFMGLGDASASSKSLGAKAKGAEASSELWGIVLLLINLIIDGATNSTQDEIFSRYKHITGQQMMFWLNLFASLLTTSLIALPLPPIPIINPKTSNPMTRESELHSALRWISAHPDVVRPLGEFAATGAIGQLFIFETLQHFGSLTLT